MKMEERRRINMGRGKSKERKGIMKGKNDLKTEQLETKKKKNFRSKFKNSKTNIPISFSTLHLHFHISSKSSTFGPRGAHVPFLSSFNGSRRLEITYEASPQQREQINPRIYTRGIKMSTSELNKLLQSCCPWTVHVRGEEAADPIRSGNCTINVKIR